MKKERMLKLVLVIIMGIMLVGMATSAYALSDDEFLDITDTVDTNTIVDDTEDNLDEDVNIDENTNIDFSTDTENTNVNANYNTNLPEAGVAENTMLGVAVTILAVVAVYAYRKVKYYKNI